MRSLDAKLRDLKIKTRKFRNKGLCTGMVRRLDGNFTPIYLKGNEVDKFLRRNGDYAKLIINVEGTNINTKIVEVQRHIINHNAINLDFHEI
ncbi:hypothetical protein [Clostridium fallax]|uniref:Ribosomal protein L25 (General stress protein Ctc) n=1 Tax=Clostridium fallax TaxID=1533 RepID=A0A1M4WG40_9CLOT|nr:hypothetical protein [Clostridium fallax]SHE80261.1 Ribosomal protein L25 (general stress protein Ctc) [Clostridium fallax]SQB04954.1 50S ribosomal protein L25 [Clostridium fallax]